MGANESPSGGGGYCAMTAASEARISATRLPLGSRSFDQ